MNSRLILPDWPLPAGVRALSSTRLGGHSPAPYTSLNLGDHVGDLPDLVAANRQQLVSVGQLPQMPLWLEQVHSTDVLRLSGQAIMDRRADAVYTDKAATVCAIMTADCLPVLFCSQAGDEVAAAHAGWRGLCAGVLENTLTQFRAAPENISVWLGPAIGPQCFEVGCEVRQAFMAVMPQADAAFLPYGEKYLADIYLLARQRLQSAGVTQIYGGDRCTQTESDSFFSYRRDKVTGRMASMIWIS